MTIGERIHFFRTERGYTQKQLGIQLGFSEKTADIRIAQYESGSRKPKQALIDKIAQILNVSPKVFEIDEKLSDVDHLMHVLFALVNEHAFQLDFDETNGKVSLTTAPSLSGNTKLYRYLYLWCKKQNEISSGKVDWIDYEEWMYNFPNITESEEKTLEECDAFCESLKSEDPSIIGRGIQLP